MQSLSPARLGACLLTLLFAGAGCRTADVTSTVKPGADFSRYKTFNFAQPVASPGPALLSEQNRNRIESTIANEMLKRSYVQAQDADLLFAIELQT